MKQVPEQSFIAGASGNRLRRFALNCAPAAAFVFLLAYAPHFATAQENADTRPLLDRIDRLEKTIAAMQAQLSALTGTAVQPAIKAASSSASPAPAVSSPVQPTAIAAAIAPAATTKHGFMEKKPGKDLTFYTPNGQITAYGNLDVSVDVMTKGTSSLKGPDGLGPVGNMGWMPDLSTNISYVGVRGFQKLGNHSFNFIYQLETEIDIASSSGVSESNSSQSNIVKAGLTGRTSFLGVSSPTRGAIMFGKTFAPYKLTTARLNPFIAMIGDNAVVMGNTGGDNRVEFGTLLAHSILYTLNAKNGFRTDILFSPGQNRSNASDNIAAGESDCTGNDIPGSGGSIPFACNDGSFSNAVSVSASYTREPLYITAAYERHMKVNRASDLTGMYATPPANYFNADVADEDAGKVGVQYTLPSKTTVSGIFETMHRYLPGFLQFQNERQRMGNWLAVTQVLSANDSLSAGWAHAYRAPGDPGQHNTSAALPPLGSPGDGTGGAGVNNSANMFTVAYRHKLSEGVTAYIDWAGTFNSPFAHYDLGAGGRIVTVDCHDASDATGGESSNPHCWAGGRLKGVSAGLNRRF